MTDAKNPLVGRVFVNRVWQNHFGTGLVSTPNDFGVRGTPPTHPELLDLPHGAKFITGGWSVKKLHREILLSATYQQGANNTASIEKDPGNVWLGRFARRRLTAEEIRDCVLAVTGTLDRTPGTAHPFPEQKTWGYTQHAPFAAVYDHDRRSVYLMTQRIKRHPFLSLFDGPDPNSSTPRRDATTVPTQSLFFLNDPFVHAKSDALAAKLMTLPEGGEIGTPVSVVLRALSDRRARRTCVGELRGGVRRPAEGVGRVGAGDVRQQRVPVRGLRMGPLRGVAATALGVAVAARGVALHDVRAGAGFSISFATA